MSCWCAFRWMVHRSFSTWQQSLENPSANVLRKAAAVNGTEDHDRQRRSVTARKLRGFSTWAVDYTTGKTRFSRKNRSVPGGSSRFYIHLLKCGSKEPVKPTHSDRAREQAEASCLCFFKQGKRRKNISTSKHWSVVIHQESCKNDEITTKKGRRWFGWIQVSLYEVNGIETIRSLWKNGGWWNCLRYPLDMGNIEKPRSKSCGLKIRQRYLCLVTILPLECLVRHGLGSN